MENETTNLITKIDQETFEKNKDYLMKLFLGNNKLICWILWCLDLAFNDLSQKQMFDYIGKVSDKELDKIIKPLGNVLKALDNQGAILDLFYKIFKNLRISAYLDIENEASPYSFEEKEARSIYYFCTGVYFQKENDPEVDRKHYRNLKPEIILWIFPIVSNTLKNTVRIFPIHLPDNGINFNLNKTSFKKEEIESAFRLNSTIYFCYLGNPEDIDLKDCDGSTKEEKLSYLIYLLDLVFGYEIEKNVRIKNLGETFNLKGTNLKETISTMDAYTIFRNECIEQGETIGEERGIKKGEERGFIKGQFEGKLEGINESINSLAHFLLNEKDNTLTKEEALKKARTMIEANLKKD